MGGASRAVDAGARAGAPAERRSQEPVAILSRRLNVLCVDAVDELQVAAGVETVGINDRIARDTYGCHNVFDLAVQMYRMVPARPEPRAPRPNRELVGNDLLRGIGYLLPALLYIGLGRVSDLRSSAIPLMIALIFVWATAQGMVFLQQRLLGRDADSQANRIVRMVSLGAVLIVTWITQSYVLMAGLGVEVGLAVMGQTVYFLGASVLFAAREERRLVALVTPGASVAALAPIVPGGIPGWFVVAALASTVLAVAWAAWQVTGIIAPSETIRFAEGEVGASVRHTVHGFLWACFVVAGAFVGGTGFDQPTLSVAAVPLVLSLGFAEWQVRTLGARSQRLLGRHSSPVEYGSAATTVLWVSLGVYTAVVGGMAVLTWAALAASDRLEPSTGPLLIAYVLLGVAMFVGLTLTSRGDVSYATAGTVFGLLTMFFADHLLHPAPGIGPVAYLLAAIVFTIVLGSMASVRVRRPVVP